MVVSLNSRLESNKEEIEKNDAPVDDLGQSNGSKYARAMKWLKVPVDDLLVRLAEVVKWLKEQGL